MNVEPRIEAILEEKVRPMLRSHGGEVRLDGYADGVVSVELLGACSGCPSADLSTRGMIEDILRAEVPEVTSVELTQAVDPELLAFARKLLGHETD